MVITGLTRNQLSGSYRTKGSNPLPSATEKPVIKPIAGFYLMSFSKSKRSEHTAFLVQKETAPMCFSPVILLILHYLYRVDLRLDLSLKTLFKHRF